MLTDPEIMTKYKQFHKVRSKYGAIKTDDGTYKIFILDKNGYNSVSVRSFLNTFRGYVHPLTGYFNQYGCRYEGTIKTYEYSTNKDITWDKWCLQSYKEFGNLIAGKNKQWKNPGEKKSQIKTITLGENKKKIFSDYLPTAIKNLKRMLPLNPELTLTLHQRVWARRYMEFALICANPERAKNICELRIGIDIVLKDGKWFWNQESDLFKNREFQSDQNDLYAKIPDFANEALNYYIKYVRPHLIGGKVKKQWREKYRVNKVLDSFGCPIIEKENGEKIAIAECLWLCRPAARTANLRGDIYPFSITGLRDDIVSASCLVDVPGCYGWTTHLTRFIISTGIQANGGNIQFAADVLRDNIETVTKHYTADRTSDAVVKYGKMLDAAVKGKEYISDEDIENIKKLKQKISVRENIIHEMKNENNDLQKQLEKVYKEKIELIARSEKIFNDGIGFKTGNDEVLLKLIEEIKGIRVQISDNLGKKVNV